MSKKYTILTIFIALVFVGTCIASVLIGLPAIADAIDNVIAAGPGAIITAVLGILFTYNCLIPLAIFLICIVILIIAYKNS